MQFGFTVIFVPDVQSAIQFYEAAFGVKSKFASQAFGMLDTGSTTLAFGSEENEIHELAIAGYSGSFRANSLGQDPAGIQISFIADDVQAAYARAISAGATPVYAPQQMPWGQWVSRVRDLNGVLVSIVSPPRF
jgi:lactoylglutathione lyase